MSNDLEQFKEIIDKVFDEIESETLYLLICVSNIGDYYFSTLNEQVLDNMYKVLIKLHSSNIIIKMVRGKNNVPDSASEITGYNELFRVLAKGV